MRCRCCGLTDPMRPGLNICVMCSDANCIVPIGCNRGDWATADPELSDPVLDALVVLVPFPQWPTKPDDPHTILTED